MKNIFWICLFLLSCKNTNNNKSNVGSVWIDEFKIDIPNNSNRAIKVADSSSGSFTFNGIYLSYDKGYMPQGWYSYSNIIYNDTINDSVVRIIDSNNLDTKNTLDLFVSDLTLARDRCLT